MNGERGLTIIAVVSTLGWVGVFALVLASGVPWWALAAAVLLLGMGWAALTWREEDKSEFRD